MATFQLFLQSGLAKDLSAPLYKLRKQHFSRELRQRPCLYLPNQPYGSSAAHCLTVAFASHFMTRKTYGLQYQPTRRVTRGNACHFVETNIMTTSDMHIQQSRKMPLKRHRCHNKNYFTTNEFSIHGARHTRSQHFSTWPCSVRCHSFTRCSTKRSLQTTLPKNPEISTRSYATRNILNQPVSWQIMQLSMKYRGADKSLARPDWKKQLKSRHFSSDPEVIAVAETWLDRQTSGFFFEWLAKDRVWSL